MLQGTVRRESDGIFETERDVRGNEKNERMKKNMPVGYSGMESNWRIDTFFSFFH